MLENAARVCEAKFGMLFRLEDGAMRPVASLAVPEPLMEFFKNDSHRPSEHAPIMRVARTKQLVHVLDLATERAYLERSPVAVAGVELGGIRTTLIVPLLKDDELIGAFALYRQEVRAFTDKQVELVKNFAAQAVIAIENTRLLNELRESLQRQTATSQVLSVISSSPANIQPVLEIIGERAERLCDAETSVVSIVDGDLIRLASIHGMTEAGFEAARRAFPMRFTDETVTARAVRTRSVCHVADVLSDPQYQQKDTARVSGYRGCLGWQQRSLRRPAHRGPSARECAVVQRNK
jgi:two-component system, NtrC family, sensor kinase